MPAMRFLHDSATAGSAATMPAPSHHSRCAPDSSSESPVSRCYHSALPILWSSAKAHLLRLGDVAIAKESSMAGLPRPNGKALDFTLPDSDARPVKLSHYRGKNVVLAFYPADWSPVCTSELALFQETLDQIHDQNAEIIGVSVDSPYSHRAWSDQQKLTFPLLSDFWPHGSVSREYGVFREQDGVSDRALIFIDDAGNVRSTWVAEDPDIAPGLDILFDRLSEMNTAEREKSDRG